MAFKTILDLAFGGLLICIGLMIRIQALKSYRLKVVQYASEYDLAEIIHGVPAAQRRRYLKQVVYGPSFAHIVLMFWFDFDHFYPHDLQPKNFGPIQIERNK